MNMKINTFGVGPFSKLMVGLQYAINKYDVSKIGEVYFDSNRNRTKADSDINLFNYVFENDFYGKFFSEINCDFVYASYVDLFNSNKNELEKLKKLTSKIKIKQSIIDEIIPEINGDTLGVHIRLTDMCVLHRDVQGDINYDDFEKKIEKALLENKEINKIFVASDNIISLRKLEKKYDIIYNKNVYRHSTEENDVNNNFSNFVFNDVNNEIGWKGSFLECLSLSKCGYLVHGLSNLNNASVIFSDSIKKTYRVYEKF